MADSIRCPSCRAQIPLSDVISHQIEEQLDVELAQKLAERERELRRRFEEEQRRREELLRQEAADSASAELIDLRRRAGEQADAPREAPQPGGGPLPPEAERHEGP